MSVIISVTDDLFIINVDNTNILSKHQEDIFLTPNNSDPTIVEIWETSPQETTRNVIFSSVYSNFSNPTGSTAIEVITAINNLLLNVPEIAIQADTSLIVDDNTTNAIMYPTWVTTNSGSLPLKVSSSKATFNPSTGDYTITGRMTSKDVLLSDETTPSNPVSGKIILASINQQGFSVIHHIDNTGALIEVVRDNLIIVRNNSGSTIAKGNAVYINGSTGTVPTIALAKANSTTTLPCAGIVFQDISNNSFGRIMIIGNVENFDLSAFTTGDLLYVSTSSAGGLTNVKPSFPNYAQSIGTVLNNGVGNGVLQVFARVVQGINYSDLGTNIFTWLAAPSSANLAAAITDETGTDALVFANAPTLINPIVGTQSAGDNSTKAASTAYADAIGAISTESSTTPVTDNAETTGVANTRFYAFFTLPSAYRWYVITGIEWKNGTAVAGNVTSGVEYVDANPPTLNSTLLAAAGQLVAQTGTSTTQRVSIVASDTIMGGTILGAWINFSSASATVRHQTGLASQNVQKSFTESYPMQNNTAFGTNTNWKYIKVYYKGFN